MVARTIQHVCSAPGSSARFVPRAGLLSMLRLEEGKRARLGHEAARAAVLTSRTCPIGWAGCRRIHPHVPERPNMAPGRLSGRRKPRGRRLGPPTSRPADLVKNPGATARPRAGCASCTPTSGACSRACPGAASGVDMVRHFRPPHVVRRIGDASVFLPAAVAAGRRPIRKARPVSRQC
jgi:hypothetical protein